MHPHDSILDILSSTENSRETSYQNWTAQRNLKTANQTTLSLHTTKGLKCTPTPILSATQLTWTQKKSFKRAAPNQNPRPHSHASTIEYELKETYRRRPKPRHPFRIMVSVPFQVLEFHSVTLLPEAGLITKPGKTLQGYKNVLRRATVQGLQRPRCNPPWRSRKFQNREIGAAV